MRIAICILMGILYLNELNSQIKLTIIKMEIASNVEDLIDNRDGQISIISLIPRIKAIVKLTNCMNKPLELYWSEDERCVAKYNYKNIPYKEKCINTAIDVPRISGVIVPQDSSYSLKLLFTPPQFPRENYMSSFLEIIPSLQFIYKGGSGSDKYCYISDKINWNNITISCTVDIKTEE